MDFDPKGPGQWGVAASDPVASVVGAVASQEAAYTTGWNDASRHAQWSADMAQTVGEDRAKAVADAHEVSHPNDKAEQTMDLMNNHNGRVLGAAMPSLSGKEIAEKALARDMLQTTPPNPAPFR